jgi:hypothetical protein
MKEELILKLLEKLLDCDTPNKGYADLDKKDNSLTGEYVIVRCRDAGVHCGTLLGFSGPTVMLANSRRLWYWKCKGEHSLSGLARKGVHSDSKLSGSVDTIVLLESCEIIPISEDATESFKNAQIHNSK